MSAQDFVRFLLRWQHVAPHTQLEGRRGLLAVIEQLQGFELAAGAFEESVLPARVAGYRPEWLDELCLSGEVAWARLAPRRSPRRPTPTRRPRRARRAAAGSSRRAPPSSPSWRATTSRGSSPRRAARPARSSRAKGAARELLELLRSRGALFQQELVALAGRLPIEVEEGLWDLVARGLVTADGFAGVRAAARRARALRRKRATGAARARRAQRGALGAGAAARRAVVDPEALAEAVAAQLLARWGVVFRDLLARESLAVPVARAALGAAPHGGARQRARRPLRDRLRRRAVRAARARSTRSARCGAASATAKSCGSRPPIR